jgi:hypothetical protein
MTAEDRVIAALEAHGSAVGWNHQSAQCPAHDDRSASLSIGTRSDDPPGVLLNCHAGCDTNDVLRALELQPADLFDEPLARGAGRQIVATYDYVDEAGTMLFQVCRFEPKTFRQRRPNGNGGWTWGGVSKIRRVLYRLPAVLQAAAVGATVYVTEGEKDVHALEVAGAVATCNPMGAGKWHDGYSQQLRGARVIVIRDRDDAGRAHADAVLDSLRSAGVDAGLAEPATGKDAHDHLAAGHVLDQLVTVAEPAVAGIRSLRLTRASDIEIRPVRWLWSGRIALGTLALLGGREGIGKSTVGYSLAADITRGRLPGAYDRQARAVIVAAAEDSWEHTIVPRLMAAGADLELVYRVDITTAEGVHGDVSLPRDLTALRDAVDHLKAALILLDPLMSRLDAKLDTHKDADVRVALEPLVQLADATGAAILGLIHVNKSMSTDPLTTLMASRAFAAVARGVLFAMIDPDDETTRLLGQPKNNLGRTDLPTLTFRIDSAHVADTDEGPVFTGRINWLGETSRSIREVLESASETADSRSAVGEAGAWLQDFLTSVGRISESQRIKEEGKREGHSADSLKRARVRLKIKSEASGFPRRTYWSLPNDFPAPAQSEQDSGRNPGESAPTALTAPTEPQSEQLVQSVQSAGTPARARENCPSCGLLVDLDNHQTNCQGAA